MCIKMFLDGSGDCPNFVWTKNLIHCQLCSSLIDKNIIKDMLQYSNERQVNPRSHARDLLWDSKLRNLFFVDKYFINMTTCGCMSI